MSDLLTDLKTAYEKLGYEADIQGEFVKYKGQGHRDDVARYAHEVTPDLCKEMKDWMEAEPRNWDWELKSVFFANRQRCYWMIVSDWDADNGVSPKKVLYDGRVLSSNRPRTEEEAILAAFLEVTKEKSE